MIDILPFRKDSVWRPSQKSGFSLINLIAMIIFCICFYIFLFISGIEYDDIFILCLS
jgi:hypothetical protein